MHSSALLTLALAMSTAAIPTGMRRVSRRAAVTPMPAEAAVSAVDGVIVPYRRAASSDVALKNGQDAIALNKQFASIKAGDACTAGQDACAGTQFAQCVGGKYVVQPCAATTVCAALPLVNSAGTSVTCTTPADRDARLAATGASTTVAPAKAAPAKAAKTTAAKAAKTAKASPAKASPAKASPAPPAAAAAGDDDLQNSFTLDQSVVQKGYLDDGQQPPVAGQFASLTSPNNFINFCAKTLPGTPLTNGLQIAGGSCNGAPIGLIPSFEKMPSSKFVNPKNLATIPANTNFTIQMVLNNIDAGHFTNAQKNYYAAPQQLNADGVIIGHTHVVIESLPALDTITSTDPRKFVFFKGINTGLENGQVSTPVGSASKPGVPAGFYRLCSQNAAMNHQPVIVPIAQHGNLDDCVYFTAK
ncbi:hypothetical protein B0H16DRAFT_1427991 [Mycena metata]|uniref:Carbohydrate-binding module family 19 domain-containing protein n=1 Tax=Mycena metata TaxID=1033252 RepID=A0AAD7HWX3_9AGAR|nr:hypothetical protein B0H16DRAFT_1428604 [Mycena metata]KAJ7729945.1 hypothetical protein B0H16DRAFT_1427991 [Mycena metata]